VTVLRRAVAFAALAASAACHRAESRPVDSAYVAPRARDAQRQPTPTNKTVLFVCEHGTVKSLLAKVLFEQYAQEVGLLMRAESRGTHADSTVPPWMLRGLALDHVTLGSWHPKPLGAGDLATASYIVSFDVPGAATAAARAPRAQWNGLPSVTQDYSKGRDAIKARVHQLVDSLKRAEIPRRPRQ
jgi:protein-tyrosine-phosphatase